MTRWIRLASIAVLLAGCADPIELEWAASPDTRFINGNVYTGAPADGLISPTAVAVRNGEIVFVGTMAAAQALAGASTELVDLGGAMMLPGLFDNHVHAGIGRSALMEWEGGLISEVPGWVREARTIEELQAALRKESARVGSGEWIVGALSREVWHNGILPTRADLDAGTDSNPVLLTRGPHTTVLNSTALELAGIDRTTTFPGGGHIGHDDDGKSVPRIVSGFEER